MCEIVTKMWSGIFFQLGNFHFFFNLSKIYFAKVPKLPKEFYTCMYKLYQFNHIIMQYQVLHRWQEAQLLLSNADISLLCHVAMQQDGAALIYNLVTMKGTVGSSFI